jgi:hypothetical protein
MSSTSSPDSGAGADPCSWCVADDLLGGSAVRQATIPEASVEAFDGRGHDIYQTETRRCSGRIIEFIRAQRSVSAGGGY